jgi:hypothetical protein
MNQAITEYDLMRQVVQLFSPDELAMALVGIEQMDKQMRKVVGTQVQIIELLEEALGSRDADEQLLKLAMAKQLKVDIAEDVDQVQTETLEIMAMAG